ncbi:MAG: tetratricopeptide repeat protein [Oscillospiraceae bacterium]|jgi:tetratricopeptide (TPR) repeat protein|nr:tetratricopeptide repeat protein [Oscillospiraceae bacterium]
MLIKNHPTPGFLAEVKRGAKNAAYNGEAFKREALAAREAGNLESALGYADLMVKTDQLSSGSHLLRGWILQDLNRVRESVESLERALELNRGNFQASSSLAAVYSKSDPQKALEVIDATIAQMPGEVSLREVKAKILFSAGRHDEAIAALDEAVGIDPLNADLLFGKAAMLEEIPGQELGAVVQYQRVVALNENHLPAKRRLAQLLADNQPEIALGFISSVTAREPGDREASLLKARLLEKTGNESGAIRQYKAYLELDEGSHEAYAAIGRILIREEPERALPCYEKAAELAPENPEYHIGRGRCYLRLERREEALAAYKEALLRDSSSAVAHVAMGGLYREEDPARALSHYEEALRLEPKNPYCYQAKGEILSRMPGVSHERILDCYDRAVRLDPGNAELQTTLGRLLEGNGSVASALEHYRMAVGLDQAAEEALYALARLLKDSEPQTALGYINRAIAQNPQSAEYYYIKSLIYSSLGGNLEAARELREALSGDQVNLDALQELRQLLDGDAQRVAMMYINRALEILPGNPVYLCERAELLLALGERGKALRQFELALEEDEGFHPAHFGIARLCEKDSKRALEHLDRAINISPQTAKYYAYKAIILARDGSRYPEAIEAFDSALALDNSAYSVMFGKAELLEEHGEIYPAIACYRRVLLIDRDHLAARVKMASLLCELNPQMALRYIDEAIALDPGTFGHHVWRARILHGLGRDAEGEEAVAAAVALGGEREEVYCSLALVFRERLPEAAAGYCKRAMAISPDKAAYPLLLGNIRRVQKDAEGALSCFSRAIALDASCHEALARTAEYQYLKRDQACLETIDRAIAINGGNASYFYIRGLIMAEILPEPDRESAVACMEEAIRLAPGELRYRDALAALLREQKRYLRYFKEKHMAKRLRQKLGEEERKAREMRE